MLPKLVSRPSVSYRFRIFSTTAENTRLWVLALEQEAQDGRVLAVVNTRRPCPIHSRKKQAPGRPSAESNILGILCYFHYVLCGVSHNPGHWEILYRARKVFQDVKQLHSNFSHRIVDDDYLFTVVALVISGIVV